MDTTREPLAVGPVSAQPGARATGSIVAVLTAPPAAFAARSIHVNPLDGRNLNRCFPGDATGDLLLALAGGAAT